MATLLEEFAEEFAQALAIGEDTTTPTPTGCITFPAYMRREDFERMTTEIQAALHQAELRGEQKAIAFFMGEGSGEPVGIVKRSELILGE